MSDERVDDILIDRYVDGVLSDGERQAFEARMHDDASLREEVELQRRIDDRVRTIFRPSDVRVPDSRAKRMVVAFIGAGAIAAAVLIVAGVVLVADEKPAAQDDPPPVYNAVADITPRDLYRKMQDRAFEPDWVSTSDEDFMDVTERTLGRRVRLGSAPNVKVVGWASADGRERVTSTQALVLLCKVDGTDVALIMDRVDREREVFDTGDDGINVFRRVIGDIVLYEITPLAQASLLPLASLA